jgi:hypothetical protein
MKKITVRDYRIGIVLVIIMLVLGSVAVNANVQIHKYEPRDGLITSINDEENIVSVTIPIGTYEITDTEDGHEIIVEDFGRLLIPGKPNLPAKIFAIALPPGAKVTDVIFDSGEGVVLPESYDISPAQLPRVIGHENPISYEQERQTYEQNFNLVYTSDAPYPGSVGEVVRTAGYRKYNLVDVRITPFTYKPVSKQVTQYPKVTVHVHYTISEDFSLEDITVDNLPRTERIAQEIIINYEQAKQWYPSVVGTQDSYDFVIITLDSLTGYVTPLVNWEAGKGRSVNVVTTTWIASNYDGYDLAEKIRNFLREKYPSSEWGIEDVLLVGHYDNVPMRRCWQDVGYGKPETDYYYAELSLPDSQSWDADGDHRWGEEYGDPIDFYAEVNVGRIPWSSTSTVQHICEKSVAYEQNNDPAFKKNMLLLGAFFWDDTDNAVLMETKIDQIWMQDWTFTRMYEQGYSSYPSDYNLRWNNVQSVWSSGTFAFVNWAGHGSPYSTHIWYYNRQAFVDIDTCPYLNDDYPAIIFADACSNSDTDYTNIGQKMLQQGAIGFLGATKVAFGMPGWNDPNDGSSQSFDYYFTTRVTTGTYTQGEAHQWALRHMYTNGLWYMVKYEMFEWGAFWGNPNLGMGAVESNYPPQTPVTPSGVPEGVAEVIYEFTTSTIDPEGDSIYYMFDWGDGRDSGWLGPFASGEPCVATNSWYDSGNYQVCVKAKDIHDRESGWSDALSLTVYACGDVNKDTLLNVADVVFLINYLFRSGPAPILEICTGDCNADGTVDTADVIHLVNHLFKGGLAPGACCG